MQEIQKDRPDVGNIDWHCVTLRNKRNSSCRLTTCEVQFSRKVVVLLTEVKWIKRWGGGEENALFLEVKKLRE